MKRGRDAEPPLTAGIAKPAEPTDDASGPVAQRLIDVWRHEVMGRHLAPLDAHFLAQTCRALRRAYLLSGLWDALPPSSAWIDASGPARALWLWQTFRHLPRAALVPALIARGAEVDALAYLLRLMPSEQRQPALRALVLSRQPSLIRHAVATVLPNGGEFSAAVYDANWPTRDMSVYAVVAALADVCDAPAAAAALVALTTVILGAGARAGACVDTLCFYPVLGAGRTEVACVLSALIRNMYAPRAVAEFWTHCAVWALEKGIAGAAGIAHVLREWRDALTAGPAFGTVRAFGTNDADDNLVYATEYLLCVAASRDGGLLLADTAATLGTWLQAHAPARAAEVLGNAVAQASRLRGGGAPDAVRRLLGGGVRDVWRAAGVDCSTPLGEDEGDLRHAVCLDDASRALLCAELGRREHELLFLDNVVDADRVDLLARLTAAANDADDPLATAARHPDVVPTADGRLPLCERFFEILSDDDGGAGEDYSPDEHGARCFDFLLERFPREARAAWGDGGGWEHPVLAHVFDAGNFGILDVLLRRALVALPPLAARVAHIATQCERLDWLARAHAAGGPAALAAPALCALARGERLPAVRHYLHVHGCACTCGAAYRARAARIVADADCVVVVD